MAFYTVHDVLSEHKTMVNVDGNAVEVLRGSDVRARVQHISDFVKILPISLGSNNKLCDLITDLVQGAEHDAFIQGFHIGRGI